MESVFEAQKRSVFVRVYVSLLWLLPFLIITRMIVGGIVGGVTSSENVPQHRAGASFEEEVAADYASGKNASVQFFERNGGKVLLAQVFLWLVLALTGRFPGTGKYIKEKELNKTRGRKLPVKS